MPKNLESITSLPLYREPEGEEKELRCQARLEMILEQRDFLVVLKQQATRNVAASHRCQRKPTIHPGFLAVVVAPAVECQGWYLLHKDSVGQAYLASAGRRE